MPKNNSNTFIIIDSHAMVYRAYFALQNQNLTNPLTGQPTFAIHGFFRMFLRLLLDYKPKYCAIVWDHPSLNFRHQLYKDYKSTRKPMPDDLRSQIEEVRNLLEECGFYNIDKEGFEADDVIGTLAHEYGSNKKNEVLIISGDKDCFQLLDEKVQMLRPSKGTSEFIKINPEWVKKELGVNVEQIIDYMALIGDTSDNVPGVPGIGPKTAANLLKNYNSIENIYKNIDKVNPINLQTKLKNNHDTATLSKKLVTINVSLPEIIELPIKTFEIPNLQNENILHLFRDKGYNQIYNELKKASVANVTNAEKAANKANPANATNAEKAFNKANTANATNAENSSNETNANNLELLKNTNDNELNSSRSSKSGKNKKEKTVKEKISNTKNNLSNSKIKLKNNDSEIKYKLIQTIDELKKCFLDIEETFKKNPKKEKILVIDTESTNKDAMSAEIVGLSMCAKEKHAYYIPLYLEENNSNKDNKNSDNLIFSDKVNKDNFNTNLKDEINTKKIIKKNLKEFLEQKDLKIIGQNIKYDYIILQNVGISPPPPFFDTMIASYLCNPIIRRHNMDDMALDLLNYETITYEELVGKGAKQKNMSELEPLDVLDYACEDADITYRLYLKLKNNLIEKKLESVFEKIEMPLVDVLERLERVGVLIDLKYFSKLSKEFQKKLFEIENNIFKLVGHSFNISSTRELQKVLYEDLKLPQGRKIKTGFSTDQEALEQLKGKHVVIDSLLEHRKYSKLFSTYIETLPQLVNPNTGRIHTSLSQTIAATGRLSSMNPNLQNIPIKEEIGRAIRRGFIAPKDNFFVSLDYSQVELRIMAHYSKDPELIKTLSDINGDIHTSTAQALFNVSPDSITSEMRSHAKVVNFSIIYGVTKYGLANSLKVDQETASIYIEKFFEKYSNVKVFMNNIIEFAKVNGYVQTLSGRIRQIPEINSSNHFRREGQNVQL